jgi:Xaa-Pro aminopeptidase
LHHIAKKFFDERGYGKYFIHGIGHFMGIDVHDVGAISEPLRDGDVFTIEPGIYIPEENIGIRIEDDYWMVKDGVVCLSEALPKKAEDIEAMMLADTEPDEEEEFDENELSIEEDEDLDLAQS